MENRDMKDLYQGIEIDEPEVAAYRRRLEKSLVQTAPQFSWPRYAIAALLVLAAGLVEWRAPGLDSVDLDNLQAFVEKHGDHTALYQQAQQMQASGSELLELNSFYVLSSLGQNEENILASAQGLIKDPRAEFRAYYLDYLLTYADEAYYDIDYLEALLDRETDSECQELLEELLDLAERQQRREPVFI